jgi:hypothetical protein
LWPSPIRGNELGRREAAHEGTGEEEGAEEETRPIQEELDAEIGSAYGDRIYLDPGAAGESGGLDRGPRRIRGREVLRILLVHLGELGEVCHENRGLHDVLQPESGGREHSLQVGESAGSLRYNSLL